MACTTCCSGVLMAWGCHCPKKHGFVSTASGTEEIMLSSIHLRFCFVVYYADEDHSSVTTAFLL